MFIAPSEELAQLMFEINDVIIIDEGSSIEIESETIHPLLSVIE
tara:strand:+ start:472 stop:603 length:132 start_codon:yes stop_codon:yes gene_type:complete